MRAGSQPVRGRLGREPVARQRGDHHMERVRRAAAVRRGIGERLDDLQLLDDRAGPAVRDDERQRVLVLRADVDEVDVEPVDLGHELRQGVQLRLAPAPVVVGRPVARELLHRSRAARPASRRRPSRARATWSPRCAGAGRRAPTRRSRSRTREWLRALTSVADICSSCHVVDVARAGAKKSMSSWLTRSASSWWTQCEASGRRSTRSRLGTSSWWGSASVGPR